MAKLVQLAAIMLLSPAAIAQNLTVIIGATGGATGEKPDQPYGLAIGPDRALYYCEIGNHRISRFDLKTHKLSTFAGTGQKGYAGDGGPAAAALTDEPYEVAFDNAGNLFFCDRPTHVIRRVDHKTGIIATVAGTGKEGYAGDGAPALQAQFRQPHSIAYAPDGILLICDILNFRVRSLDPAIGIVETWAGTGQRGVAADGAPLKTAPLDGPRAIAIDRSGNYYLALREGNAICRIAPAARHPREFRLPPRSCILVERRPPSKPPPWTRMADWKGPGPSFYQAAGIKCRTETKTGREHSARVYRRVPDSINKRHLSGLKWQPRKEMRSKIEAMRAPESRVVLMSVVLVGIGSMMGAFLDRISFPHVAQVFNTCASSRQFIVEFRKDRYHWQAYWPGTGAPGAVVESKLDVDGIQVGSLSEVPLRRFLCEGNHTAHVRYPGTEGETETHTIDFAVSRPSLFQVSQSPADERKGADCNSAVPCTSTVCLHLSPYEPDDLRVRIYPEERK